MKDATRYHRPFNSLPLDRLLTTLREKRKASGNILGKEESACIIIMLFSFFFFFDKRQINLFSNIFGLQMVLFGNSLFGKD